MVEDYIGNNDKDKEMTEDEMIEEVIRRNKEGDKSSSLQDKVNGLKLLRMKSKVPTKKI